MPNIQSRANSSPSGIRSGFNAAGLSSLSSALKPERIPLLVEPARPQGVRKREIDS